MDVFLLSPTVKFLNRSNLLSIVSEGYEFILIDSWMDRDLYATYKLVAKFPRVIADFLSWQNFFLIHLF